MSAGKILPCALVACFLLSPLADKPGKAFSERNAATGNSEAPAPQAKKPVRRAVLVGIENYERDPEFQPTRCQDAISRRTAPHRKSSTARAGFISLEGSMNDVCAVRQLLIARYGFEPGNIHILANQDATRSGILSAFRRYLIDEAQPGDVCFFFYSGHGSQVKNTLGGEPDQLDETLVPFDWKRPITKREDARDIRDKEVFKLFREAAKKVTLTALFDSCHSGGVSRGGVTGEERSKTGPAEVRFDFAEPPPDQDQEGLSDQEYLEKNGVLVISAARDDQEAKETAYNDQWRGNFTYALVEVLQSPNANNLSVARIFDKLVIQMKSHKHPHEPVIVGSAARRRQTLFGEPVDPSKRPEVNVESVDAKGNIALQGGRALGLNEGCEFIKKGEEPKAGAVRIRISQKPDYVKSVAEVIADDPAAKLKIARTIRPNDTFVLEKWAAAGEPNLVVWIPPAKLTTVQLMAAAQEINKLGQSSRVQLVADPTAEVATHFLSHDGANWLLKLPDNQTTTVGQVLTAKGVLDKLPASDGKVQLFYSLPPSTELAAQIKLGDGTRNSAVGLAKTSQAAHYWLVGRARGEGVGAVIEYAWLLPESTVGVATAGDANSGHIRAANTGVSPLPPLTDWKAKPTDLEDLALRLGKIRGWVKLEAPEGDSSFAYRLVLRNSKGEDISPSNAKMEEGDNFYLFLVADESLLQQRVQQRHVYIFSIDGAGKSDLFYPNLADGYKDTVFPVIPASGQPPRETSLVEKGLLICGPDTQKSKCRSPGVLGPETYVMLTTVEPLPDPLVLQSDGVRTPEEMRSKGRRSGASSLQDLLTRMGSTSRSGGRPDATPVNWSVQQVFFQSVEKKP